MKMLDAVNKSKFMSSVPGAALKDATLKYALAKAQGKRNPHIIAKDALLRNMFMGAYKADFDPNLMMGGDKTIPATFGKFSDKMEGPIPAEWESRVTPAYTEYGQDMMDKWYGPGRGGPYVAPSPYDVTTGYGDIVPERLFPSDPLAEATFGKRSLIPDIADAPMPLTYKISDEIPGGISDRVSEKDFGSAILKKSTEENPLAGLGYMTTTKEKPSMLDRLLGKVKEAKEAGIERGSDEWNEMFDIGATRPDMSWAMGTAYDWFRDPLTEAQQEREEEEDYERKMARLMYPRSMDDVPNFQKGFLGYKNGGIASLANGGRIGYQGGGIGPAGATLEETPMAARKEVTIKSQLEDLYKLYMEKGLLTPGLAKMFGWDDPNEYYNNEIWQRDFSDPLNANVRPEGNILNQTAYDPEGAGPMTPMTPYPDDDDFRFDEGTIGPNPTFEDEFGGYLDLAGGGREAWEIRAEIDDLNNTLLETSDPGQRQIIEIKINELLGQLGTTPSAARGGRLNAKDGLWANIHAKRKRIAGGSGETMRSPGSAGAPTDEALKQSQATGGIMGYAGGGMTDEEKITYQGLIDSGYTRNEAIKIIELHGTDYSGLQIPSFLKSQAGIDEKAQGGRMGYYGGGELNAIPGGMISGPGTETSDSIPAQLSNNEFVVTADAVRAAGGGDIDLGAQKFYGIMNALDPNSAKLGEPPVYS